MAEEKTPEVVSVRVSKDELAALVLDVVDLVIPGIEKPFGIRPLTWKEDDEIDQAVMSMSFPTAKTERDIRVARSRERMRQIVQTAVVEPKFTKSDIQTLPVGLVIALGNAIDEISSYQPKNE